MTRLGLRARLVAAFVGIAVLASIVAALLTSMGLHRSFDSEEGRRLIYEDTQRFMSHDGSTVLVTVEHLAG